MPLTEYRRKRKFNRTPEPRGRTARRKGRLFVVQSHAARRLHYDFRLELDGVLKSWAVPKGPSLDPGEKRLAIHVEDHPLEYGEFEGTIPQGEYGGGTVLLWDRGRWEPLGDPHAGFREGKLKFTLHGKKLRGGWLLVRRGGRGTAKPGQEWLLFKQRDEEAQSTAAGDVLEEQPLSVESGRDLEGIARIASHSNGKAPAAMNRTRRNPKSRAPIEGARRRQLPDSVKVQLATLAKDAPEGDEWLHEIKLDGYRMLCRIDAEQVRFISRNQHDWTSRLSPLVPEVRKLPVEQALLDGEMVAMKPDGTTDFQALQNAFKAGRVGDLRYYVFDLLHQDGYSLEELPLEERKRHLAELLSTGPSSRALHLSEHLKGAGPEFLAQACRMHLEGIVSKRRDRPYRGGRGYDWLKIKCVKREEFVIGGYTDPAGSRTGFGALLVGSYNRDGDLHYAGKVGTGFDDVTLKDLLQRLEPLHQRASPFVDMRQRTGPTRTAHWVAPRLVAQVSFGSRTQDGRLRHSAFQGLREDKPARDVVEEQAVPLTEVMPASSNGKPQRRRRGTATKSRRSGRPLKRNDAGAADASLYDARKQEFDGVRLTSPEKVLYPEQGVTKLELARYYRAVADWILPHIVDRPLSLLRCPEGRAKACFFQKHPGAGAPETLRQVPVREKQQTEKYVVVDDRAGLISLAQIGALELHAWGSRADKLEQPDRLVFDLDPDPQLAWKRVVESARQVRDFLGELGLESFVKTTGGKGLHIVVPIDRRHGWDETKKFCKQVADAIVAADPSTYTANMAKAARIGRIFVDYLRNGRGATAVVPYSTRAQPGATISTPLTWKELNPRLHSDRFNLRNIFRRLAALQHDPWEGIDSVRQGLGRPRNVLEALPIAQTY